jgi:predicted nucleic acid-binding protein
LSNIDKLSLLRDLYGVVVVTPEVAGEFGETLPEWIAVVPVKDPIKTRIIEQSLDLGEASVIALAMETEKPLLILDDGKARRFAKNLALPMTGTLGIVAKAHHAGFVDDLKGVIADFRQCGFRIPNDIENELLNRTQRSG